MKDIIALCSGGMDSTTALYKYADEIVLALSFDYGSKHNAREIEACRYHCERLGLRHQVVQFDFNKIGIKSDLLTGGEHDIPTEEYNEANMKQTVVPFRNGIMLAISAGIGESIGAKRLLLCNHAGDHFIYPDCTPSFVDAMGAAIKYGTTGLELFAPFTNMTKREIALVGKDLDIPYEKTYSCYKGGPVHCGECATCLERKEALEGFDKTEYLK